MLQNPDFKKRQQNSPAFTLLGKEKQLKVSSEIALVLRKSTTNHGFSPSPAWSLPVIRC